MLSLKNRIKLFGLIMILSLFTQSNFLYGQSTGIKPLKAVDYVKWESLGSVNLSSNGQWLVNRISKNNNKESYLELHNLNSGTKKVMNNGSRPVFSKD
ncbi:hypothetical protein ACFLTI_10400 [Bacteroidota bacterium]